MAGSVVLLLLLLLVVVAVLGAAHVYLWRRLVRDVTASRPLRRAGAVAAAALTLLVPATLAGTRLLGPLRSAWLAWPGFLWMALLFYLVLALAVLELPRLVLMRTAGRSRPAAADPQEERVPVPAVAGGPSAGPAVAGGAAGGAPPADVAGPRASGDGPGTREAPAPAPMGRRLLIARGAALAAGAAAAATVGHGLYRGLGAPDVKVVRIGLKRLDPRLAGFRITMASDIHLGPILGRSHTERIVRLVNATSPDVVAVVGDLADGSAAELGPAAEPLARLTPRHGAFFVTGNHDYLSGADAWIEELAGFGVRTLRNEHLEIARGAAAFDLAGVNDVTGASHHDGPDFDAALRDRDPSRAVVLLAHQPVQVHEAVRHGVDLQLSGHTHGGQLAPFNLAVRLQQPVVAGLARMPGGGGRPDTQLYVSRGAGAWGPPVRVGAPPDITVIELHPA
ncbi:metallophosphoesterase [Streptomyces sp. NPDC001380]|uniref:metallophosphoesterase n=1 Tax=Streptomyces sp. NPDC001380 TaxID=3364566 RepID=UPI00367574ED